MGGVGETHEPLAIKLTIPAPKRCAPAKEGAHLVAMQNLSLVAGRPSLSRIPGCVLSNLSIHGIPA